jgi:hypothetical protein
VFTDSLALRLAHFLSPFLQCTFSILPALSAVCAMLQFTVCYSVLLLGDQCARDCVGSCPGVDREVSCLFSPVCSVN